MSFLPEISRQAKEHLSAKASKSQRCLGDDPVEYDEGCKRQSFTKPKLIDQPWLLKVEIHIYNYIYIYILVINSQLYS